MEVERKQDGLNDDEQERKTEITLATWNVQTWKDEIMEELGKARVDVVAVQEIRWQEQGRIKIFSSSTVAPVGTGRYGTGFIVSAKMRKRLLAF